MPSIFSTNRLRVLSSLLGERLWFKPLVVCLLSIGGVVMAKLADSTTLGLLVPKVSLDSIETLLSIMATSMLVIATFAVSSMVSAYASASVTATPRSFGLVVADDVSQNALATFIGAFIFSIVAIVAVKNGYFDRAGLFVLFALTVLAFASVIITFVRWVDSIARLGRLGQTIERVESATAKAFVRRSKSPWQGGLPVDGSKLEGLEIPSRVVGYVQYIDVSELQAIAEELEAHITIHTLQGAFVSPSRSLVTLTERSPSPDDRESDQESALKQREAIQDAFTIGNERRFDDDPRFGVVVLSEIAGRALSPAINDPGTAIGILSSFVRIFHEAVTGAEDPADPEFDRVSIPLIPVRDFFDDAFTSIARDGAGTVEVAVRLQKALATLATLGGEATRQAAIEHSRMALARAEATMTLPEDLEAVRDAAAFARG